jgi:hypothetical protein
MNEERPPKGPLNSLSSLHTANPTASIVASRRRRDASHRLPVLESGLSDPWWYPEPGDRGYEHAAMHLLSLGLTPSPNLPAMRAMYRCGGESRRVAQVISERWGLVA